MMKIVDHVARPAWGRGIIDSVYNDYTTVLFESGQKSAFKQEQLALLHQVDGTAEEAAAIRNAYALKNKPVKATKAKRAAAPAMTLDEQVRQFLKAFPKGFQDDRFVREERGRSEHAADKGRLQRAIDQARTSLSHDALEPLLERKSFDEIFDLAVTLMGDSGLVEEREIEGFKAMPLSKREPFAQSLFSLLHDDDPITASFGALCNEMGTDPGWSLVTLLPALAQPEKHCVVWPAIADKQASILDVETTREPTPSGRVYARFQRIATDLKGHLEKRGLEPRDLMDVFSFSSKTLGKKAPKSPRTAAPTPAPSE